MNKSENSLPPGSTCRHFPPTSGTSALAQWLPFHWSKIAQLEICSSFVALRIQRKPERMRRTLYIRCMAQISSKTQSTARPLQLKPNASMLWSLTTTLQMFAQHLRGSSPILWRWGKLPKQWIESRKLGFRLLWKKSCSSPKNKLTSSLPITFRSLGSRNLSNCSQAEGALPWRCAKDSLLRNCRSWLALKILLMQSQRIVIVFVPSMGKMKSPMQSTALQAKPWLIERSMLCLANFLLVCKKRSLGSSLMPCTKKMKSLKRSRKPDSRSHANNKCILPRPRQLYSLLVRLTCRTSLLLWRISHLARCLLLLCVCETLC
mmetsp:Transcript_4631/g.8874  ORF Transcript_4631/g.8874 Transcript_4631/m.8874 type:complete len:319 (+) Transcript_4631:3264-4220(+)